MDLFFVTGETSGDLAGAHLAEELMKKRPGICLGGVLGPRLRALGILGETKMEELQVMGFIDVFLALPRIVRIFYKIRKEILRKNPKAVVLIDYPGLNLRLARSLRKCGFQGKIIQYVCPTVWAWGKKRIPLMAEHLDLLLTLFPFEPACFAHTKLPAFYVGHPLVEKTKAHKSIADFYTRYNLDPKKKILALFPGSREKEILRNFPIQLEAAKRVQKEHDLQIVISLAQEKYRGLQGAEKSKMKSPTPRGLAILHKHEKAQGPSQLQSRGGNRPQKSDVAAPCSFATGSLFQNFPLIEPEHRYDLMQHAHLALATSGTVTLELALFKTPAVVCYAMRPLDVFLAKKVFRIDLPHYCIVNILAQKTIYQELLGPHLTVENLTKEAFKAWSHPHPIKADCAEVCELLEEQNLNAASQLLKSLDF